jgi:hypothetical protein
LDHCIIEDDKLLIKFEWLNAQWVAVKSYDINAQDFYWTIYDEPAWLSEQERIKAYAVKYAKREL